MIIAVDGSAASGKGTLAKRLASHFDLAHLDTGALYRALGLDLLRRGLVADTVGEEEAAGSVPGLDLGLTESMDIRTDEVAAMASIVAAMPAVRQNFLSLQRDFASNPPHGRGAVLDGRDIGSIILPEAPFKFFIDANLEIRADRRTRELQGKGQSVMFRDVFEDMRIRDERDRGRSTAPLCAAADAVVIDTSTMDADAVFTMALSHIETGSGT